MGLLPIQLLLSRNIKGELGLYILVYLLVTLSFVANV